MNSTLPAPMIATLAMSECKTPASSAARERSTRWSFRASSGGGAETGRPTDRAPRLVDMMARASWIVMLRIRTSESVTIHGLFVVFGLGSPRSSRSSRCTWRVAARRRTRSASDRHHGGRPARDEPGVGPRRRHHDRARDGATVGLARPRGGRPVHEPSSRASSPSRQVSFVLAAMQVAAANLARSRSRISATGG